MNLFHFKFLKSKGPPVSLILDEIVSFESLKFKQFSIVIVFLGIIIISRKTFSSHHSSDNLKLTQTL